MLSVGDKVRLLDNKIEGYSDWAKVDRLVVGNVYTVTGIYNEKSIYVDGGYLNLIQPSYRFEKIK